MTVIVAVYQGEHFVLSAIRSALNQTHRNIQLIVIDDGSTDRTWSLLLTIRDSRVSIHSQPNGGASAARNRGLALATGEYIAFLDADDRWLPDKLETELRTLERMKSPIAIAYSWYYAVDDRGMLLHRSTPFVHSGNVFDVLTKGATFILPSASLFHHSIFPAVGAFDDSRLTHEDLGLTLRACRSYPAFPSRRYSVIYRQSISGKGRAVLRSYDAALTAVLSIGDEFEQLLLPSEVKRLVDSQLRALYLRFLMYGFDDSAKLLLRRIGAPSLRGGAKELFGWLFAKTGVNMMLPSRRIVQFCYRVCFGSIWLRFVDKAGLAEEER